jgi:hypothetical protein
MTTFGRNRRTHEIYVGSLSDIRPNQNTAAAIDGIAANAYLSSMHV